MDDQTRAVDFATDADLDRLRSLRRACESLPRRVRCKRCREAIPVGKRRDAIYCSTECKRVYGWEQRAKLVHEIRVAVRAAKIVPACTCGTPLRTDLRRGPVPQVCTRCYMREAQRRHRLRSSIPLDLREEASP
jgi:hypothetical protein